MKLGRALYVSLAVFFWIFSPTAALSKPVIQIGLCPKYNSRVMYQLYQPFVDYLSETAPYQFEIKLCRFYQETVDRLGKGETPIALCGPIPYLKAKETYKVKPIVRALSEDGKAEYRGIIVVRNDSPLQNLSGLKGRSLAFAQEWSTAGYYLPRYHLLKAGISLKDLKNYGFLRHHDFVVDAVLKKEFDAGAVKDVIANKYQQKGIRHIFVTDPTPTVAVIASPNAPKDLVSSVRAALLKLNPREPADQKRMSQWDEEINYGFMEASDSDYEPIRKILQFVEREDQQKGSSLRQ